MDFDKTAKKLFKIPQGGIIEDTFEQILKARSGNGIERNSFIDNILRSDVKPAKGSVILCDLSPLPGLSLLNLNAEHTGIYVGRGRIIHRSGDGYVECVTPQQFLERLDGKNAAISVYVSCRGKKPLGIEDACERAIKILSNSKHKEHTGYNILTKNCHLFTRYCLSGKRPPNNVTNFTFSYLEKFLIDKFGLDNWRIWNYQKKVNDRLTDNPA